MTWHEAHRLDRDAQLDERVTWHLEHTQACGCRPMPVSVRAALDARSWSEDSSPNVVPTHRVRAVPRTAARHV